MFLTKQIITNYIKYVDTFRGKLDKVLDFMLVMLYFL